MHASVHSIGARDYSPQQLAAWSPCAVVPGAFMARVSDGRTIWVAEGRRGQPVGFVELENNGHIDCFYCLPTSQGTGSALYSALEADAVTRAIPSLFVEASEAARQFFVRAGFGCEKRRDFTLRGVALHNYRMTKKLR
ncbi:GNAT family N-acetyltransferase [Roseovarius sp. Pro17]|uniref:GNAT family N-acetyltransferase n=1 Tax=Roseovarius sp. Pro17 TaxID=3108175 RepID=UPI002D785956|nr:GNAT family N-acetyltransferase [Roseovarius sp. Pro17]